MVFLKAWEPLLPCDYFILLNFEVSEQDGGTFRSPEEALGLRGVAVRRFSLVICRKMGERTGQQAPGAVGSLWGRTAPGRRLSSTSVRGPQHTLHPAPRRRSATTSRGLWEGTFI